MAGKKSAKGSDKDKQLTLNIGVDAGDAVKTLEKVKTTTESAAKAADKTNKSLEKTNKELEKQNKHLEKQNKLLQEKNNKLTDEERKRKNQLNEEQKLAQIKLTNAKIEETNQRQRLALENAAYKRQRDQLKDLEKQKKDADKAEKDRIKDNNKLQLDAIKQLKSQLMDLKQEQKELQKHGYGAIVNSFTEGFPARLGTAAAYKTIGVGLETIRDSFNSLVGLQQQFAAIYAITDSTSAAMEKLRGTIMDVGAASIYSTEQLAQATITLGQAGLSAEQIVDALEAVNNLAVGTGTDLAMSVNVLTSSLAVWNKEASQAGHVADVLTTAANRTRADVGTMANAIQYAGAAASDLGVSFEEFASVASAVTNAGLKARSVVGTGFRSVLTELINPSAKLQKVFKQLGVNIEDVDVRSRGLVNVLQTLKDAGLDAAMAFQGFDRRAASFFVAATSQLDTVDKLREAFLQGGSAAKAAEKQLDTLGGQFERLKNTMKEAFSQAFRPFLGLLTEIMKVVADFTSTYAGQLVTRLTALVTLLLSLKSAVLGLYKAFQSLKAIKIAVTAATLAYSKAQAEQILLTNASNLQYLATVGALTKVTTATKSATAAVKIFGITLKTILSTTLVGLLLFLPDIYSWLKKDETALNEATDRIKASDDKIRSLTDAYDELVQKQKLYGSDQKALIARGMELNKQFELQGLLVLRASDSLQQYLGKLRLVINAEKEKQLIDSKKAKEELQKEMRHKSTHSIWMNMLAQQLGYQDEALMANIFTGYASTEQGRIKLAEMQAEVQSRASAGKMNEKEVEAFNYLVNSAVQLADLTEQITRLQAEIKAGPETADFVSKFSITLGDFSDRFRDQLASALNVQTFEDMTKSLEEVKNAIITETKVQEDRLKTQIEEAKKTGNKSGEDAYRSLLTQLQLESATLLQKADAEWKNALGKRATKAATDYQNFAKAIEKGQAGMPEKEASEYLEVLKKRVETAINAQRDYELSILKEAEDRRVKDIQNRIDRLRSGKESIPNYFKEAGGTIDTYITELERQIKEGVAKYETATDDINNWAKAKLAEATSRADAADWKNTVGKGTTTPTLLPYTAAIYKEAGFPAEKLRELEESYKKAHYGTSLGDWGDSDLARMFGTGAAARGSILYGQELWGDEKNRRFMDDAWAETALKGIQTFTDGFSNAVIEFANSAKTFKEALRDFASSSLQTIGNWLIQMSIKAAAALALKAMFPEFFSAPYVDKNAGATTATVNVPTKPTVTSAAGGPVTGGIPNRDSVTARLMPGEFVLKKSTVDYLGENFLNALNANAAQTMGAVSGDVIAGDGAPASVVNVWVVSDEEEAGMGPNDVIATITKDIRNGGQTRQLIKSIVAGRK